jgi:hypothetical protein
MSGDCQGSRHPGTALVCRDAPVGGGSAAPTFIQAHFLGAQEQATFATAGIERTRRLLSVIPFTHDTNVTARERDNPPTSRR